MDPNYLAILQQYERQEHRLKARRRRHLRWFP
jgi:hypothetical protein